MCMSHHKYTRQTIQKRWNWDAIKKEIPSKIYKHSFRRSQRINLELVDGVCLPILCTLKIRKQNKQNGNGDYDCE